MPDDEDLRTRVQVVEHELARLRDQVAIVAADAGAARPLAVGADRDVSEVRAELRGHTRTLNALRETQVEHGNAILELRAETVEMRAEMRGGFATLTTGVEHITTLLDRVIERGE
ncbi:MAG: hypothetical protein LH603_11830 [Pseudonocardia sp.]|nr:hypothetical protein [Pseudonocardia sp.]